MMAVSGHDGSFFGGQCDLDSNNGNEVYIDSVHHMLRGMGRLAWFRQADISADDPR